MREDADLPRRSAGETWLRTLGALGVVWAFAALLALPLSGATFLDMPLGAYLAGQGAFMSLLVVGVRVARRD